MSSSNNRKGNDAYSPNIFPENVDEKTEFDSASQADSGFLSGHIASEEFDSKLSVNSNRNLDDKESEQPMRLDSGVGIDTVSENLSNLNFKHVEGINDLNSTKCLGQSTSEPERQNWEIYYDQYNNGDTFLHHAVEQKFPEVALAVIRAAPSPALLNTENDDGQTALHLAVNTNQWDVARWLIIAGAKPGPIDRQGDSPLHIAARMGLVNCCKAITYPVQQGERERLNLQYPCHKYERCDLDQWNFDGQTCLHVAAIHEKHEILKHLVWLGADVNAREGKGGYTALHIAIQNQDEVLIRFLLDCKQINVGVLTYGGKTPLELGYEVKQHMVALLKSRGVPSPINSDDEYDSDEDYDDSDDDMMYEPSNMHSTPSFFIGASA